MSQREHTSYCVNSIGLSPRAPGPRELQLTWMRRTDPVLVKGEPQEPRSLVLLESALWVISTEDLLGPWISAV